MMAIMACTAIFGGSFNPPHVGHVLAVKYVLSVFDTVDELRVVPVFQHPFNKELVDFEHRLQMAKLAMQDINGARVDTIEQTLGGESRTLRTLEALCEGEPRRTWRLVVGADVLDDRHKWHRWERVVELAPPLLLGRAGYPHPEAPFAILPEVSSSQIRKAYNGGEGETVASLLPAAIRDYIAEHNLYAGSEDAKE
jgi:nicotinate-nucleotide adenylyltransferase